MAKIQADQIEVGAGPQHAISKYGPGPGWELQASRLKDDGTDIKLSDVPVMLPLRAVIPPLTNTQIKSIPLEAPGIVTLLAAPGPGKWAQVLDVTLVLDTTAGAYGADLDAHWFISYGSQGDAIASSYVSMETQLEQAAVSWVRLGPPTLAPGALLSPLSDLQRGTQGLLTLVENQPLVLLDSGSSSAYSGGNAANTLIVDLLYRILDI